MLNDLFLNLKHYFYAVKDGKWYVGYYKKLPEGHKWVSYYSDYYDGRHRALWVWRFTVSLSY
jgi:hypothetical protein